MKMSMVGVLAAAILLPSVPVSAHHSFSMFDHDKTVTLAGTLKDEALVTQATQAATWIVTTCVRVADACFALGGGSALYDSSPLQRRLRDLHAAAQHAAVQQRNYASAGKLVLRSAAIGTEAPGDHPVRPAYMSNVRPLPVRQDTSAVDGTHSQGE